MRILYFSLGWLFFFTGAVGVVLPVLPTTPFMLLALWAFSKSSQRLHNWLYHHKLFGPPIQQWCKHRVIPLQAKVIALIFMSVAMVYLLFFATHHYAFSVLASALIIYGAFFILTKPSKPTEN